MIVIRRFVSQVALGDATSAAPDATEVGRALSRVVVVTR
jgi:hypothetical protein